LGEDKGGLHILRGEGINPLALFLLFLGLGIQLSIFLILLPWHRSGSNAIILALLLLSIAATIAAICSLLGPKGSQI